ncbi:MAG TPA: TQO small subunit DoxD [Ktedonobacteraceae bacterium]|nr:TQO small subunit DoxD [Ktedonobacteraceae bacterium]
MKTTPPKRPNQSSYGYQTHSPYSADQQGSTNQPEQPSQPQRMAVTKWVLLPMRLFLGVTFMYAGVQKLTDPQFFNPAARGYIGKQMIAFATGSPLHSLLIRLVPHAMFFGALVAYGEIAIGLGALLGLLFRPAAFFGILINLVFFLSATWHVYPYFYGSDIVFIFCWLTLLIAGPVNSGMPSVDAWLVRHALSEAQHMHYAPVITFLLGVPAALDPEELPAAAITPHAKQVGGKKRSVSRYEQMRRAEAESRRNFLWGLLTGGAGIAIIAWVGNSLHLLPGSATDSENPAPGSSSPSGSTPTGTATTGGTSGSTVIAQVNVVQNNSAVNFTLASNGDPGVLVRLSNGQFVCYDATCTHAGCPVSYDPSSQTLQCPCHGAVFDPAKGGAVVQGPAPTPLTSVPIQVNMTTGAITTNQ